MTRKHFIPAVLAFAAVAAVLLAACKATDTADNLRADSPPSSAAKPAPEANSPEAARRVTPAELQKLLEDGAAVVYDTRAKGAYEQEHIKGALSMPSGDVAARMGELPKDKTIIFYCT
jgi:3-mercaptopyruvate sulfurtransferase SseA